MILSIVTIFFVKKKKNAEHKRKQMQKDTSSCTIKWQNEGTNSIYPELN